MSPAAAATVYDVIVAPFGDPDVQETEIDVSPREAMTEPGAPGRPAGVTAALGVDASDGPPTPVAVTVKVYETPFVRPTTVADVAVPPTVALKPPGEDVTV